MNPPPLRSALIGEFLGTALLILLGDGVVASVYLLEKQADWILITTGWGFAVTLGIYLSGRLSGGHINPAVTLALAVRGEFPWGRLGPYWIAQIAGAFVAALHDPQIQPRLTEQGFEVVANTPEQFASFEQAEFARWKQLIETRKITAD